MDSDLEVAYVQSSVAVQIDASNLAARTDLAFCYHQTGDAAKSYATYQQVLKTDPTYLKALLGQAHLLHEAKQPLLALQTYQQVLKVDPKSQLAHTATIAILVEMSKVAEAVSYYREITADKSVELDALSHAKIGIFRGKMKKELRIDTFVAQSLKDGGDLDTALDAAQRCLLIDSKCPVAFLVWGDVLVRRKKYEDQYSKCFYSHPLKCLQDRGRN